MAEASRIPCRCCGIPMLPETGAKTGGLCMRCFGTAREDSRTRQAPSRPPTARSRKFALALTMLDLKTFPVWKRCSDDDEKARPCAKHSPTVGDEFVVAGQFTFADSTVHFGGVELKPLGDGHLVSAPFLLRDEERINFEDHTSAYRFARMTPKLAEELRRKFQQNLARLERQIGMSLESVLPIRYELLTTPSTSGELPAPTFQLPSVAADEV